MTWGWANGSKTQGSPGTPGGAAGPSTTPSTAPPSGELISRTKSGAGRYCCTPDTARSKHSVLCTRHRTLRTASAVHQILHLSVQPCSALPGLTGISAMGGRGSVHPHLVPFSSSFGLFCPPVRPALRLPQLAACDPGVPGAPPAQPCGGGGGRLGLQARGLLPHLSCGRSASDRARAPEDLDQGHALLRHQGTPELRWSICNVLLLSFLCAIG